MSQVAGVRETHGRCKTMMMVETRIEGVQDEERTGARRSVGRGGGGVGNEEHGSQARSSTTLRPGEKRPRDDAPSFPELVQAQCQRPRKRRRLPQNGHGETERNGPDVLVDCMFMGDEKEGSTLALLVARERTTKAAFCTTTRGVASRNRTGDRQRNIIVK